MADIIKIKGGSGAVPTLQDRELAYSKDEQALYIGTESGNVKLVTAITDADVSDRLAELSGQITDIIARLEALEPTE